MASLAVDVQRDIEANIPKEAELTAAEKEKSASIDVSGGTSSSSSTHIGSSTVATSTNDSTTKEEIEEKTAEEPLELPSKRGTTLTRYIFHTFFSAYRRIFATIFMFNLIAFIVFTAKNNGSPSLPNVKDATSANVMVCILFRQENVVNLVYELFVLVPHSLPLRLRANAAKVFHYGGVHSGCGVAAVVWFILYTGLSTRAFVKNPTHEAKTSVIVCYFLVGMFLFILAGAHPKFRVRYHDYFEAVHRFAGWCALGILWSHTFIIGTASASANHESLGKQLISQPSFWFLIVSTCCSVISWGRLRKREVFPEVLSDHATRLHFKYTAMRPFYGVKLSDSPLFEWHAFATIPDHDENKKINGFSVVVSNAGDWTKRHIQNPPKKLWIRGYPLHGLLYTSKLFKKIVLVATGSGIGPCLSLMYSNQVNCRILWSTPNPETVFGQGIIDEVNRSDPHALIWNTRQLGRPDIVALTYRMLVESDCEAVFVISNPKVTKKIVYGMENRGIPAYGAIFDS